MTRHRGGSRPQARAPAASDLDRGARSRSDDDSSILAGRRPVLERLRAGGAIDRILIAEVARGAGAEELKRRARDLGVPLRFVPRVELDRLAPGLNHQGVVAMTSRWRYAELDTLLRDTEPALLLLDGVMDPHNLGSLLRSARVAGFGGAVVRAHRAAGVTAAVRRVAAGAAETLPVARVSNLARAISRAQAAGLWVVGLDERGGTELWACELLDGPVALVLGAEDRGLSKPARDACDALVRIPEGAPGAASLNVAVAGAVAMFEVARRRAARPAAG